MSLVSLSDIKPLIFHGFTMSRHCSQEELGVPIYVILMRTGSFPHGAPIVKGWSATHSSWLDTGGKDSVVQHEVKTLSLF